MPLHNANPTVTAQEIANQAIEDPKSLKRKILYVSGNGAEIPVRFMDIPNEGPKGHPLVVVFHGGFNRKTPYPFFFGQRFAGGGKAPPRTVLSLCDPTLSISDSLRYGWFAGHSNCNIPLAVRKLLKTAIESLMPSRVIIAGGSIGAHAALYHTSAFPGSVTVCVNPLPKISEYTRQGVEEYFETCWPGEYDPSTLTSPHVVDDAGDAYDGKRLSSSFVIIQNPTDPHLFKQALPLLQKLSRNRSSAWRVLPVMPFRPESTGHTMPSGVFERWIEASIRSPSLDPKMIALTHEDLDIGRAQERSAGMKSYSSFDRELAKEIARKSRLEF